MADDLNGPDTDDTDDNDAGKGTGAAPDNTGTAGSGEWTAPTKEEWERTQRALTKANAEAKSRREALTALQKQTEDADGKKAREQAEAAEKKYKPLAIRSAAKAAFLEAGLQGVTPERVAKLIRMLDLDALSVDDDGDILGLDDQVKAVKADYPELFATGKTGTGAPRVTTGNRTPANNGQPKTTGEKIAAGVLGR